MSIYFQIYHPIIYVFIFIENKPGGGQMNYTLHQKRGIFGWHNNKFNKNEKKNDKSKNYKQSK